MNSATRASLLEQLQDGTDALAWDEFFQRYWPPLYTLARHRGCSDHTAKEVVQDVMLKVFQQRDIFHYDRSRGRFRDWLGAVVRNQVFERRRRPTERDRAPGGEPGAGVSEAEADGPQPDAAWEAAFEQSMLMALLDIVRRETPPEYYLAFELLALNELPVAAVTRATGLSRHAIYRARRRILQRLGQLAGSYPEDGRLQQCIKEAVLARPGPVVERSLVTRVEKTMQSRQEVSGGE